MSELSIEKQDHIVCNEKIGLRLSGKSSRQENEYSSSTRPSKMVLKPNQPPIQLGRDALPEAKAGGASS